MFQFIYKFVSAQPFSKASAGGHLLDDGTLYVARFNDDGTGDWLALAVGQNGLTSENGFCSQAEVRVNTRAAAKNVGATRMDRPESGAIEPTTGAVYFSLTSNIKRQPEEVNKANPLAEIISGILCVRPKKTRTTRRLAFAGICLSLVANRSLAAM